MDAEQLSTDANGHDPSCLDWTKVVENSAEMQEPLTEFNLSIMSRLASLEDGQRRMMDYLSDAKVQMSGIVGRHEALLIGTLQDPGLLVRLDRLEMNQAKRDKLFIWMSTTMFASLVTLAIKVFL